MLSKLKHFYAILFIATLCSFKGCFQYEDVDVKGISNVRLNKADLEDTRITMAVDVDNPNPYNIKIKSADIDIYVNDKKAGTAKLADKVKIKKMEEDIYDIELKTNGKELLKGLRGSVGSILSGRVKLNFKGNIRGGAYGISKKFPIDFTENFNIKDFL